MKKIFVLVLLLSIGCVSAIGNVVPVQIQVTNDSGNVITGTYEFTINISNSDTCSPVLYSNISNFTTDARGIVAYSIAVDLSFDEQYYLCYYRDGSLKETRTIGVNPYAFRANVSDYLDSTRNYEVANLTAIYFLGDGSQLTGLAGSDTWWGLNENYIYNNSNSLDFNETLLNTTIDLRDDDTTYTNGTGLSLTGTVFSLIGSIFSGSWNDLTDMPSGFADGIDNDTSAGLTHLTNFTDDILWTSGFNSTFDSRDQDTTYTNGTGLSLNGDTFSIILSYFTDKFIELTDTFGGDVSGTYDAIVVKDDSHTHAYQNITNEPWIEDSQLPLANLTTPYCGNITGAVSNLCTVSGGNSSWNESGADLIYVNIDGDTMTGNLNMSDNNILDVENYTGTKINVTCCVYLGTIQATDGNSIAVQPTGDTNDFFSFKTPSDRPTIKREGGKFIYFDSSNIYDVGISLRDDDTYSGTLNYEKDTHKMTLLGKNSPVAIKTNSEYVNYFLFETYNHQPQLSVFNGTKLVINDSLEVVGNLNVTGIINASGKVYSEGTEVLTSYAETDPYWSGNQSSYSTTSEILALDYYNNITNFTGTLTNDKICVYDSSQQIINCTYTDQTGVGGNVKSGDGTYTYNDTDTIYFNSTYAELNLEVNGSDYWDSLDSPADINAGDLTDDGTYRLNSWDNLTGIPHATPTNGDTTHFSLADEIYDFVIGLTYATTTYVDSLGNWSADKGDYSTTAEAGVLYATIDEPLWYGNYTAYNNSWSSTYNSTYDAYNNTGLIKDWNSTGYITNWNSTGYIINWNNTGLIINWSGDYITEETDPIFTAWDNLTGIPHATPTNGDTTHFSLAGEIYDWVIGLGYLTSISNIFNQDLNTTSGVTFENVSTKAIYGNGDVDTYINWTGTGGDQLELFAGGISFMHLIEGAGNGIAFNQDSNDIDWRVESNDHTHALAVDGGTNKVRMDNYTNCDTIDTDASGILSCGTDDDTQLTEDQVEAFIFDSDNTDNIQVEGYNVTNISYSTFCNGANCWKMYVNASDYFIIEEI